MKHKTYWQERAIVKDQLLEKDIKKVEKELLKAFKKTRKAVLNELKIIYADINSTEYAKYRVDSLLASINKALDTLYNKNEEQLTEAFIELYNKFNKEAAIDLNVSFETINENLIKSFFTQTDDKGHFSIDVLQAPTTLSVEAKDYITCQYLCNHVPDSSITIELNPFSGTTISMVMNYTPISYSSQVAESMSGYNNYRNIYYTIYNYTKQKQIDKFEVNELSINITDTISSGDSLLITAHSYTNEFAPTTVGVRKKENNSLVAFLFLVEQGGISVSYTTAQNNNVIAMLYDNNGRFVTNQLYDAQKQVTFNHLSEGEYSETNFSILN